MHTPRHVSARAPAPPLAEPDDPGTELACLRAAVAAARDAMVTLDEAGRVIAANPAAGRLLGYAPGDLLGVPLGTLVPEPDVVSRANGTREGTGHPVIARRRDGARIPLWATWTSVGTGGGRRVVVGLRDLRPLVHEKRQRRAGEARLRSACELVEVGTLTARVPFGAGDFTWSPEVYRALGRDPTEGPIALRELLDRVVHQGDRLRVQAALRKAWGDGQTVSFECRVLRPDGTIRALRVRVGTDERRRPRARRWYGAVHDVTDERELLRRLVLSEKMEAIARLTAVIAHEYNDLLMGIRGCAELARRRLDAGHPAARFVDETYRAAARGGQLSEQLLDFGVPGPLAPARVSVDEIIERSRPILCAVLGARIELRLKLGGRGLQVWADPSQIEQVLMNLTIHARDAMADGGAVVLSTFGTTVDAASATGVAPVRYLVLSVEDTGLGMDASTLARVFDPSFTTRRSGGGAGLGLSTAYGIVQLLGGDIRATSQPGEGSTFAIYFPAAATSEAAPERPSPSDSSSRRRERVLLVEDEPLIRLTLRSYLEPHGYEVLDAGDGEEAGRLIGGLEGGVDLLVTDVMLPGADGPRVAEDLLSVHPDASVIFMSAHPRQALEARLPLGATLLQKPFTEERLMLELRRALDSRAGPPSPPPARA